MLGRHREEQDADAGPRVRRLGGDRARGRCRPRSRGDHRGGEAGHRHRRLARPFGRVGGDDDRGGAHAERFGKGVVDRDAVAGQLRQATSSKTVSTPASRRDGGLAHVAARSAGRSSRNWRRNIGEPRCIAGSTGGRNGERAARAEIRHLAVAHDELAALEDEMRAAEHRRAVREVVIDRDVGERARAEMAAVGKAEQPRRRGPRHGGDLGERIFALRISGKRRHLDRAPWAAAPIQRPRSSASIRRWRISG